MDEPVPRIELTAVQRIAIALGTATGPDAVQAAAGEEDADLEDVPPGTPA